MAEIEQQIPEYEGDLPNKDEMTPDEFDAAAEAWVTYQATLAAAINTWATEANALGVSANDLAVALASMNFLGRWEDLSLPIYKPCSVWHDHNYWMLLEESLMTPEASEPSLTNSHWAPIMLNDIPVPLDERTPLYEATAEQLLRGARFSTEPTTSDIVQVKLPAPQSGYKATFYCGAAEEFGCLCEGYPFRWGARVTGEGTDYDYLYTQAVGTCWTVQAFNAIEWVVTAITGAITATEVDVES